MTRMRPPSAAADPRLDLERHRLSRLNVATTGDLRRVIDDEIRNAPSTPRVPPVLSGNWSDGSAARNLARLLHDLGILIDQTSEV